MVCMVNWGLQSGVRRQLRSITVFKARGNEALGLGFSNGAGMEIELIVLVSDWILPVERWRN